MQHYHYGMQFSSFNEILMYISCELAMATDNVYANKQLIEREWPVATPIQ